MWTRSETDKRRVVIVDIMHLCYKAAFGGMPALSATIKVGEGVQTINTTIPTFVIKQVHRWSKGGINPVVCCFDSRGGNRCRKAYFAGFKGVTNGDLGGYKSKRQSENGEFYESINAMMYLLYNSGVCCLKADNYEADDLIKAAVDLAKVQYPDLPIDIVTGDTDIVPLVDEQVSVFLYSRKITWAESADIEKKHYVQLTPDNYSEYLEGLTNYKNLVVPYNTLLLTKLLRGDKADEIAGYPKFTPTKYKNLIYSMQADGVDLGNLFRYDSPTQTICYRDTEEPIPQDLIGSGAVPRENMMIKFGEPPKLTEIKEVLSNYLDEDIVKHVEMVYNGINLNGAFVNMPDTFKRRPAELTIKISGYNKGVLQSKISRLRINLPMV